MKNNGISEYFTEVETKEKHRGYYYSVAEAITIVILGSLCGLKNVCQIHQWAENEKTKEFLKEKFAISEIPCYYWLLCLLKMIKPESLNYYFMKWIIAIMPDKEEALTIALDGKTIRSTGKMRSYDSPLHIVSAQLSEFGITLAQKTVDGKSNEIPAVKELLRELNIKGNIVVADALNCQKDTAETIVNGGGDYLLCVKDNQLNLREEISDYCKDEQLQRTMNFTSKTEKNRGRMEKRTAFCTDELDWMQIGKEWKNLKCIGAIHTEFTTGKGKSDEWHYYISSKKLTAEELLHHARMEWSVEPMHWLLDVRFDEDYCRVEDKNVQQNLNMLRKMALNLIKLYKEMTHSKKAMSKIMFDCLLDNNTIVHLLEKFEN